MLALALVAVGVVVPLWVAGMAWLFERDRLSAGWIIGAGLVGAVAGLSAGLILGFVTLIGGELSGWWAAPPLLSVAGIAAAPMALIIGMAPAKRVAA